jgi:small subunit ribosomal protein S14
MRQAPNIRNSKKALLCKSLAAKRANLKKAISDKKISLAVRFDLVQKLNSLPKNSSKVRVRSRCFLTGRPRGVYKKFGLCRNKIRELAGLGLLPGLTKSSW